MSKIVRIEGREILDSLRIPTDPDARSNDIRTVIPEYPDKLTRRL